MADKPTNKERLKELGEKIEAGIREVFDSGKYAEYLKVMSRFPTYSVNNQILYRCPYCGAFLGGRYGDAIKRQNGEHICPYCNGNLDKE